MTDGGSAGQSLVGTWRLSSWVVLGSEGEESGPIGDDPEGLLVYSPDGTMIALMGAASRAGFAGTDVTGGTEAERAAAFATFIAYGGSYEVAGSTVTHRVEISLFPNWVRTVQERQWELDASGRELTLISPPLTFGGRTRVQRLRWERVRR